MYTGFYMRGWLGGDNDYPLIFEIIDDDILQDLNSKKHKYIESFLRKCDKCEALGDKLLKLPLLFYDSTHQTFTQYFSETLESGIKKYLENTEDKELEKTTSNLLCWSSYRYIHLTTNECPFSISKFQPF